MNSNAEMISPSCSLASRNSLHAESNDGKPKKATLTLEGRWASCSATFCEGNNKRQYTTRVQNVPEQKSTRAKPPPPPHRDDAQRAFAADEQLLQVVPDVVLPHGGQAVQHSAVSFDHLQAGDGAVQATVPQVPNAASVRGSVSSNLARAFGPQVKRHHVPMVCSERVQLLQHAPGFAGDDAGRFVEVKDGVHGAGGGGGGGEGMLATSKWTKKATATAQDHGCTR